LQSTKYLANILPGKNIYWPHGQLLTAAIRNYQFPVHSEAKTDSLIGSCSPKTIGGPRKGGRRGWELGEGGLGEGGRGKGVGG
jgi:hypothetical protein